MVRHRHGALHPWSLAGGAFNQPAGPGVECRGRAMGDERIDRGHHLGQARRHLIQPGVHQLDRMIEPIDHLDEAEQHREDDRAENPGDHDG